MVNAIICDLGEVLVNGFMGVEKRLAELTGLPVTNQQLQTKHLHQFFKGKISEEALWRSVNRILGQNLPVETLMEMVRRNFTEVPGTKRIIREVRETGIPCTILSVHGKEWVEYIEKEHKISMLFNSMHFSYKMKVMKPDQRAFELAAESLRCDPHHCLVIDDSPRNIEVANNLSFQTHLFVGAKKLREDLRRRNVI